MLSLCLFRYPDTLLSQRLPLPLIPLLLLAHGLLFPPLLPLPPHLLLLLLVHCAPSTLPLLLPPVSLSFLPCLRGILLLLKLFIKLPHVR